MFEKVFRKNSMSHACVDFRYVLRDVPVALAPSISGQFTVFPHLPRPSCWRAVRFAGEQETRAQLRTVCQRPRRWPVATLGATSLADYAPLLHAAWLPLPFLVGVYWFCYPKCFRL